MLKSYNLFIASIGTKLRNQILFDIFEKINHYNFFKIRFFKTQEMNDLILKYI